MNAIANELQQTKQELSNLTARFTQAQINTVPFQGSWTAAQVNEHLLKSDHGLLEVAHYKTEKTERAPDEKIPAIKSIFLDFSTKYQSPDSVFPGNAPQIKEEMLNQMKGTQAALVRVAETLDLSETCSLFEFPGLGYLTRMEWLYFNLYHSQRHLRQLGNILKSLETKQ